MIKTKQNAASDEIGKTSFSNCSALCFVAFPKYSENEKSIIAIVLSLLLFFSRHSHLLDTSMLFSYSFPTVWRLSIDGGKERTRVEHQNKSLHHHHHHHHSRRSLVLIVDRSVHDVALLAPSHLSESKAPADSLPSSFVISQWKMDRSTRSHSRQNQLVVVLSHLSSECRFNCIRKTRSALSGLPSTDAC